MPKQVSGDNPGARAAADVTILRPLSAASKENAKLKQWLEALAADTPISFERWGRIAGVDPSGITRFLSQGYPVPKQATIQKLANAIGVAPPWEMAGEVERGPAHFALIPQLHPRTLCMLGEQIARKDCCDFIQVPAKLAHCVALRVSLPTANLMGILPGDIVVIDKLRPKNEGDVVCTISEHGEVGVYRVVSPMGYLQPRSFTDTEMMDPREVTVVGVIVHLQRDLPPI